MDSLTSSEEQLASVDGRWPSNKRKGAAGSPTQRAQEADPDSSFVFLLSKVSAPLSQRWRGDFAAMPLLPYDPLCCSTTKLGTNAAGRSRAPLPLWCRACTFCSSLRQVVRFAVVANAWTSGQRRTSPTNAHAHAHTLTRSLFRHRAAPCAVVHTLDAIAPCTAWSRKAPETLTCLQRGPTVVRPVPPIGARTRCTTAPNMVQPQEGVRHSEKRLQISSAETLRALATSATTSRSVSAARGSTSHPAPLNVIIRYNLPTGCLVRPMWS